MINFGIAPYFQSILEEALREAPYHVHCFDESHNKCVKKGQMDMHICYWDNARNTVNTRFYNSEFLTKVGAVDIYQKFLSCSKDLDANKMIQVLFLILISLSGKIESFSVFLTLLGFPSVKLHFLSLVFTTSKYHPQVLCYCTKISFGFFASSNCIY